MSLVVKDHGYTYVYVDRNPVSRHREDHKVFEKVQELEQEFPDSVIWTWQDKKMVSGGKEIPETPKPISDYSPVESVVLPDDTTDDSFTIYNTTFKDDIPFLENVGVIYQNYLMDKPFDNSKPPTDEIIEANAKRLASKNAGLGVVDIETYSVDLDPEAVSGNIDVLCDIYDRFKSHNPDMTLAYYSIMPIRMSSDNPKEVRVLDWQKKNDRLAKLVDKVDLIAPHFYTSWHNPEAWRRSFELNMQEARRICTDKPVYAYLMPQWPNKVYGAPEGLEDWSWIPADYWQFQLETAKEFADGVFIYVTSSKDTESYVNAPWYEATRQFVETDI